MTFEYAFFALLGVTFLREAFFMWQMKKLLDRAMSRSYHEYQMATQVGKPKLFERPKVDEDFPEDLGALTGIG